MEQSSSERQKESFDLRGWHSGKKQIQLVKLLELQKARGHGTALRSLTINPLLRFDRHKIKSHSINREEFSVILTFHEGPELTVWFHSLAELNCAYAEWMKVRNIDGPNPPGRPQKGRGQNLSE